MRASLSEWGRFSCAHLREQTRRLVADGLRTGAGQALVWYSEAVMRSMEPTTEMVDFFNRRTKEHIARVAGNLMLLAEVTPHREALIKRARTHDASKFGPKERVPYIWLTEYHRCRRKGLPFEYPEGVEQEVRAAIHHHVTSNRHHVEFHADPNDMTEVDLIEMVCDWTAMAQEFGEDGLSAKTWADRMIGKRIAFSPIHTNFVYSTIATLDQKLA